MCVSNWIYANVVSLIGEGKALNQWVIQRTQSIKQQGDSRTYVVCNDNNYIDCYTKVPRTIES